MPVSTRRMVFHALATGIGGIIGKEYGKPADTLIDTLGASAISGAGGRHVDEVTSRDIPENLRRWFRFDRIVVRTEGKFTDPGAVYRISQSEDKSQDESEFQTATLAEAVVENLTILDTFHADEVSVRMVTQTPRFEEDSPVFIDVPTFKGVTVRGQPVEVEIDHDILGLSTFERLKDDCAARSGQMFHPPAESKLGALIGDLFNAPHLSSDGGIHFTFVKRVSLNGKSDPDQPNRLVVPDFGHIRFGEVFSYPHSRRLAMLRLSLGSDDGGNVEVCSIQDNGSWSGS